MKTLLITAFLTIYPVAINSQPIELLVWPNGAPFSNKPPDDAKEALRIIRDNSLKWNIDNNKVGISGFSAGGHLASTVSTHFTDNITRPDFAVLFYPVISSDTTIAYRS